jgi:hypothetical protein
MNDLRGAKWAEVWSSVRGNRLAVYDELYRAGPAGCTGTQLARELGWSVLSVRPRLTELRHMHLAEETGARRDGEHVFRCVDRDEAERRHEAEHAPAPATVPIQVAPTVAPTDCEQLSLFG